MQAADRARFAQTLAGVYALYRVDFSEAVLAIWWQALKRYELEAVADAFGRHSVNPDGGQFVPKPADIVKLIDGGAVDTALVAWSKVLEGMRHVGAWESVCFDDSIINLVIAEMGGWIQLCETQEKETPFRAKEFQDRYRAYRLRGPAQTYPRSLPGRFERDNNAGGFIEQRQPVLIGHAGRAALVHRKGGDGTGITFTPMANLPLLKERAA